MPVDPIAAADLWLGAFREAARVATAALDARLRPEERAAETGSVGAGGDRTLEIDAIAETAVLAQLEQLAKDGASFTVISEERGTIAYGDGTLRVAVDPIDGSLNAKRGFGHPSMSVAVADGPTVADVILAFVWDFGARETFHAIRGGGAFLDGKRLSGPAAEQRTPDGRLELLCIETSDAHYVADVGVALAERAFRWRILGSIATAMCQVATTRIDAMVNVSECRVIDAAAASLIVRESGGSVRFERGDELNLDLAARTRLAVARTAETAQDLLEALR